MANPLLMGVYYPALITLLWIITGSGGGTVFCLERINERRHELSKADIGFAENPGHVLGVLAGPAAYVLSSEARVPSCSRAVWRWARVRCSSPIPCSAGVHPVSH